MIWAFSEDRGSFVNHQSNYGPFALDINENGTISLTTPKSKSIAIAHGYLLWVAWGVLGYVQIASSRYLKVFWRSYMWIHRITGFIILIITIVLSIFGIKICTWKLNRTPHDILGLAVFFIMTFVTLFGVFLKNRLDAMRWRTFVL